MLKKLTVREVNDFEERTAAFGPGSFCDRLCARFCEVNPFKEYEEVYLTITYL